MPPAPWIQTPRPSATIGLVSMARNWRRRSEKPDGLATVSTRGEVSVKIDPLLFYHKGEIACIIEKQSNILANDPERKELNGA